MKMNRDIETVIVEKLVNGYVTHSKTIRSTNAMYHSSLKGVVAELNRAFGSLKLRRDQSNFLKAFGAKEDEGKK